MPSLISQTAGSIEGVKTTVSGIWFFIRKAFPFVVFIGLVVFGIILYLKFVANRMSTAFKRRKLEVDKGAKASKDPSIKDVYYYKGNKNIRIGKYKGHIVTRYQKENILFVLVSKGILSDIFNGPMLICAPVGAMKELWIKNKQHMLLVGQSFKYDQTKEMYFLTGKWAGLQVLVTKLLCDDNIMELTQDYVGKLFVVQDQMVQQMNLDLKKKMKGVEDVVEDDE